MTQILVKEDARLELEKLHVMMKEKIVEYQVQIKAEETEKLYKIYENLNPRYHERVISLENAKLKIESSDIVLSNRYNIFRAY